MTTDFLEKYKMSYEQLRNSKKAQDWIRIWKNLITIPPPQKKTNRIQKNPLSWAWFASNPEVNTKQSTSIKIKEM